MHLTIGNIAFQMLSLAVLGVFCWMIYAFRAQAAECMKNVVKFSSRKGGGIENRRLYDRFLNVAMTLGAFSAGLAAVKVAAAMLVVRIGTPGTWQWRLAGLAGTSDMTGIPSWVAPTAVLAVASACAAVALAKMGIIKAAGSVTLSRKFADAVVQNKRNWMAAASIPAVPLVAVWTGVNPARDTAVAYVVMSLMVILSTLFVAHTLQAFLKQKVSLLVWFLYLCIVEIFPVCAVVLAVARNL